MRQLDYKKFFSNNHASLNFLCNEDLVKHQKVAKYYDHDCLQKFILLLMSLLTTRIVKKNLPYLSKKTPYTKLEMLSVLHIVFSEKIGKVVVTN